MARQSSGKIPVSREERKRLNRSRRLFEEYLSRQDEGESVNPEDYLKKFPDLEDDLRVLFDQLDEKMAKEEDLLKPGAESGKPRVLGDFQILKKIGSGGMATVFEAEQISLKRKVALKVLPAHLSFCDDAVKKFKREAEAGGRQSHPGIVSIYSVGEQDGMHYIAQELIKGARSLHDQLEDLRKLDDQPIGYFREAALLVAEVAEALADAHESGVIHRDVKPSNILLTEEGRPMLTDFGLAKVEDALSLSRTGEFAGTPYYMSPEQAMSRRMGIDHRTDVYSLGVTLYEMLTLKRPFDGKTSHEVLKKIILIDPKDPRKLNPRVPRDLAVICLKAMEKDPARRYQSMAEFGSDLHRFLNAELIRAKPSPLCTRVIKYVRRHPVCSAAVSVAFLGLIALVVSQLWAYMKIREEQDRRNQMMSYMYTTLLQPMTDPELGRLAIPSRSRSFEGRLEDALAHLDDGAIEPEIEMHVRWQLGNLARSSGFISQAVELLKKSLELSVSADERNEDLTHRIKNDLALALAELGHYAEAEQYMRAVYEYMRAAFTEDDHATLNAMDNLAGIMGRRGKLKEAEALHRAALGKYINLSGEKDPDTLTCKNNLAGVLADLGEYAEAEELFREVLEGRKKRYGDDNELTIRSYNNLGALLARKGEYGEAESLLREALEAQAEFPAPDHPDRLSTLSNLAGVLRFTGHCSEARAYYEEVLRLREQTLGGLHPLTLRSKFNLATFLIDEGEKSKAAVMLEEIVDVLGENEKRQGFEKRDYADWHLWKMGLAELYSDTGRFSKALPICKEVQAWRREAFGTENRFTVKCMVRMISILMGMGRSKDAESLFEETLRLTERVLDEDDLDRLLLHFMIGIHLASNKKFSEAESHARTSFEGLEKAMGMDHQFTRGALDLLCGIYEELGNEQKAREYRKLKSSGD
jgi:serine/threonine protein kinase/Tfp pilus assembly protein PilF